MKVHNLLAATLLVHGCFAAAIQRQRRRQASVAFGPKRCVKVSRSAASTCVISTACEGSDTSKTEFAFNCVGQDGTDNIVRHSFGVGGFDSNEEYDTEVKCERCEGASPIEIEGQALEPRNSEEIPAVQRQPVVKAPVPPKPVPKRKKRPKTEVQSGLISTAVVIQGRNGQRRESTATSSQDGLWPSSSQNDVEKKTVSEAVKYGPNGCVSTLRNEVGHCVLKTDCAQKEISNYEFGLVCVDKTGSPVRHLFGKDSFDPQETFDTLITCDQCLGLEDIPDELALNGEVVTMSRDISRLKGMMEDISRNVKKLNEEVFPESKEVKFMRVPTYSLAAHKKVTQTRHLVVAPPRPPPPRKFNLRHSPPKQVVRQQEEDDDDDDDSDNSRPNAHSCVLLSRSAAGSCVISTDCEEAAVAKTEFAFNCISQDDLVRHSYGMGGFDRNENFDTQVQCDRCEQAPPDEAPPPPPPSPPQPTQPKRQPPAQEASEDDNADGEDTPVDVVDKEGHKVQAQSGEEMPVQIVDASGRVVQSEVTEKTSSMTANKHRKPLNPVQMSASSNQNAGSKASEEAVEVVTPATEDGASNEDEVQIPVTEKAAPVKSNKRHTLKSARPVQMSASRNQKADNKASEQAMEVVTPEMEDGESNEEEEDVPVQTVGAPDQERPSASQKDEVPNKRHMFLHSEHQVHDVEMSASSNQNAGNKANGKAMEMVTPEMEDDGSNQDDEEVPVHTAGAPDEEVSRKDDEVPVQTVSASEQEQSQQAPVQSSKEVDEVPVQVVTTPGQGQSSNEMPEERFESFEQENSAAGDDEDSD